MRQHYVAISGLAKGCDEKKSPGCSVWRPAFSIISFFYSVQLEKSAMQVIASKEVAASGRTAEPFANPVQIKSKTPKDLSQTGNRCLITILDEGPDRRAP